MNKTKKTHPFTTFICRQDLTWSKGKNFATQKQYIILKHSGHKLKYIVYD